MAGTESFSGSSYTPFTTAGVLVRSGGGRAVRLVVTAAITGTVTIYDSLTATGQIVWVSTANPAVGTSVLIDVPVNTGIYVVPGSAGAGILVWS